MRSLSSSSSRDRCWCGLRKIDRTAQPAAKCRANAGADSGTYPEAFDVELPADHASRAHLLAAHATQLDAVLAGLRADDAHETRGATLAGAATAIPLLPRPGGAANRTEALRIATSTERMVDERKATLTKRATRNRGEGIALVHVRRSADVRTTGVDIHVEAGVGGQCPSAPGARQRDTLPRVARATGMCAASTASGVTGAHHRAPAVK